MNIEDHNRLDILCEVIGITSDDSSFHLFSIFEAIRQFAVLKGDTEMRDDINNVLSSLSTIGMIGIERHYAIIASTWCVDSADSMSQWCSTIPGMNIVRNDSFVDRSHTVALLIKEPSRNEYLRSLFLEALLEDEGIDNEPRWTYVEIRYGIGGPSVERAFPMKQSHSTQNDENANAAKSQHNA